jgi:hypothetical protein
MRIAIKYIFISIFLFQISSIFAQKTEKKITNYEKSSLFKSTEPINIELFVNKKELLRDVDEKHEYHYALIKYSNEKEGNKELNFSISTRGHFRKDPHNCKLPPLKLKVPKEVSQGDNLFSGQNKIKLVLPCMTGIERYQECLILEYLIYKCYELFTDKSYRTRLVNISIHDSINQKQEQFFTGFFLEESEQMATRNKGKVISFKRYHPENVNREQMTMLAVFQYLVGNTDWSVDVSHNINLLFVENQTVPIAVPFDFDWSGVVDAPYAVPSQVLNITSVKQRLFRGYERSIEEYEPVVKLFNDKKSDIYNLFNNCIWLSEKTKRITIKYFDEFYETINDTKKLEKELIKNCRKM